MSSSKKIAALVLATAVVLAIGSLLKPAWSPRVLAEIQAHNPDYSIAQLDFGELHIWRVTTPASELDRFKKSIQADQVRGRLGKPTWEKMPRLASNDGEWFVYLSAAPGQGSHGGIRPGHGQVLCVVQSYVPRPWWRQLLP